MVNVYTSCKLLKKDFPNLKIIHSNDRFFIAEENGRDGFDQIDYKIMQEIDNITFIDGIRSTKTAQSKFGLINVFDLSTGCKTAINLHHAIREKKPVAIDITECGANAAEVCFELVENTGIPVLLQHSELLSISEEFEFRINGKIDTDDISVLMDYALVGDEE